MDQELINLLVATAGVAGTGALTVATVKFFEKLTRGRIKSEHKFYGALALCFIYPSAAYALLFLLGVYQLTLSQVITTIIAIVGTGYMVSQTIHFEEVKEERAAQKALVEAVMETGTVPAKEVQNVIDSSVRVSGEEG